MKMNSWLLSFTFLVFIIKNIPPSSSFDGYKTCSNTFNCGSITKVGFPFWGDGRPDNCGYPQLNLNCAKNIALIDIMEVKYQVLGINQESQTLKIARDDYLDKICSPNFNNTVLDPNLFEYVSGSLDVTLFYNCSDGVSGAEKFTCPDGETYEDFYVVPAAVAGSPLCKASVNVRIAATSYNFLSNENLTEVEEAVRKGFEVKYMVDAAECGDCMGSKGVCGYDWNVNHTICYCQYQTSVSTTCSATSAAARPAAAPAKGSRHLLARWLAFVIAILEGVFGTSIIVGCIICISRKRKVIFKKYKSNEFDVEAFIRNYGSLTPKRYSYSNVKKMTNSFKDKIGRGGYGTVYKGELPEGLIVAVKVLSESKGDGEEFINEVASIGKTSHVNVVTLLGFCYERYKRALIYEYMPNGSLDKFTHDHRSNENCRLEWNTLLEIAVGVARGLEYLHGGCNTRILHFDIKPQNILLDKDFCPKISDFGLAKLCKTKESIVSMLGTRGTVGYIAPEVFSRNFGGVSHKSDVYSYGMLVLEMVGARKNLDSGVSLTSELMFPHYVYKDLELEKDENIFGVILEEEKEIARKMILISLWCIQTIPSDRPSMSKVVEMLEGPLHSLQIAPKPFLFSSTRPTEESETTSQSSETS